ncbi:hypothetical protein NU688_28900 [Variovorax sp. ZS18.2.2]|uniref:hypothetical protein n=1 Tax=Variovorax sp. ZS18.2.2 TaxID=2971255 RepID=UPI002150F156|nr:hypothetical protein [Variovorax sp. ZS18.2.2]MCR6480207.1 hypothetical protein [Variovorax sp. ZS18.2.2]
MRAKTIGLCISVVLTACHQSADPQSLRDGSKNTGAAYKENQTGDAVEKLISLIAKSDEDGVVGLLNELKKTNTTGLMNEKLQQFWELKGVENPAAQEFLMRPRVRLMLADFLVQLWNNGRIDGPVQPYVSYARGFVKSSDVDLINSAVVLLGLAGEHADVKVFEEILRSENEKIFYSASLAFSMSCFVNQDQFESMAAKIQMNNLRDHLRTAWGSYSGYRESRCQKAK